jgi:hypothetical protein
MKSNATMKSNRERRVMLQMALGFLMLSGGVMHFTIDAAHWKLPLIDALKATGYMWELIGVLNMLGGAALLAGWFVPLALLVLAPISLNILLIHLANPGAGGIPIGIIIAGLHLALGWLYRSQYRNLFMMNARLEPIPVETHGTHTTSLGEVR